jgi:CBS domain-containing protein
MTKSLARSFSCVDGFDDTPTAVLDTLGSLVRAPAVVVSSATPLAAIRKLLVQRRIPAVAVVDGEHLCGLVTRTDVLRTPDDDSVAGDAMSGFVFALPARAPIERAAALMAYEGVGQVIVIGPGGELLGMVSAVDIARYVAIEAGYLVE